MYLLEGTHLALEDILILLSRSYFTLRNVGQRKSSLFKSPKKLQHPVKCKSMSIL